MGRLEFASLAWMHAFGQQLSAHLRATEPDAVLTRCEVYTSAPVHLCAAEPRRLAWTCRNVRGDISFEIGECSLDEADVKTEGDYAAFRELVLFVVQDGLEGEFQSLVMRLVGEGHIRSLKDVRQQKPAPNWELHNAIARMTA